VLIDTTVKDLLGIDETLDVFAQHGMGGVIGLIFNGLFGADYVIGLDGVNTGLVNGGFLNSNFKQLYIQVVFIGACGAWAFIITTVIAKIIDLFPGLYLRASEEAELLGMDEDQHGEYAFDYVEVRRDYLAWNPTERRQKRFSTMTLPNHGIDELQKMNQIVMERALHKPEYVEYEPGEKPHRSPSLGSDYKIATRFSFE
jgi:Amt family ammonium transporter